LKYTYRRNVSDLGSGPFCCTWPHCMCTDRRQLNWSEVRREVVCWKRD